MCTQPNVIEALREAEAALELAIQRILKRDPGHHVEVTSEAKALVSVRQALQCQGCDVPKDGVHQISEPSHSMSQYASKDDMLKAQLAAAQQGVQPVAFRLTNTSFRKPRYEYFSSEEAAKQRQTDFNRSVDDGGLYDLTPLYTRPTTLGMDTQSPIPWISVYQRLPAWTDDHSIRVLALTAYDDFSGVQVHDIKASDFYQYDEERGMGTEVTNVCTHWVYRDAVLPGVAATYPATQGLDVQATRYQVGGLTVEWRGNGKWAVVDGCSVLSRNGEWKFEPSPSSRTDEWLAMCRFDSAQEAITAAQAKQGGQ